LRAAGDAAAKERGVAASPEVLALSDAWPLASAKSPDDASGMAETGDLTSQMSFQGRRPGHEPEAEPVIEHGEAPRGQGEAPAVNSGDSFAVRQVAVN
jgi:hypothetical protein